jgi:NADPH-dependent 2,4-dienoyl-CoA reductase/sulfur reductase-like enzyme
VVSRVLVIGGSDAGISAALRAREVAATAQVTVVAADRIPNYSICGLPFYLSGEVPDWQALAHRTVEEIEGQRIELLLEHSATAIDVQARTVTAVSRAGVERLLPYERLVIATGARPIRPAIPGLDLPGVYLVHSMDQGLALHEHLATRAPRSAAIVGGGYLGLEMADALTRRGLGVTVLEQAPAVLTTVDPPLGAEVGATLRRHGVRVLTGAAVAAIAPDGDGLVVTGTPDVRVGADLVLVAVGVRPDADLARAAGLAIGERGAVRVSRTMKTSLDGIYAAGDCAETWHRLLHASTYLPLGTTAHKQGRVAGENAAGGRHFFAGSLGTQVVKVFDVAVAATGLGEAAARRAGFDAVATEITAPDHTVYYPDAQELRLRLIGDRATGRLLGAQMLGHWQAQVAKRIDVIATALSNNLRVAQLSDLDLSYTPPLGSPWDAVQIAAQAWEAGRRAARRRPRLATPARTTRKPRGAVLASP